MSCPHPSTKIIFTIGLVCSECGVQLQETELLLRYGKAESKLRQGGGYPLKLDKGA